LKKTEEESVGALFKLSVRELSVELFDTKPLVVGELFDVKPLVEKLFFCFVELFFSKMFIESGEEEGEGGTKTRSVLIGFWSFRCMYVLTILFSKENDRFFCASKKRVSCFDDAPREQCILIDMCLFFASSDLAKWFKW
jgi:hypothetical protein